MTEYWKSTPKYYCKDCNVWISDNKTSIQNHNKGLKHKQRADELKKKKRDEKLHGARSEADLKKQLQMIEHAAHAQLAQHRVSGSNAFHRNGPVVDTPDIDVFPPPPPPEYAAANTYGQVQSQSASQSSHNQQEYDESDLSNYVIAPSLPSEVRGTAGVPGKKSDGRYTVKGQTYLEGQHNEDKLRTGVKCEIWVEEADEWLPARISQRTNVQVPNTAVTLPRFTLTYWLPQPDGDAEVEDDKLQKTEADVRSDRIRLLCDKSGRYNPIMIDEQGRDVATIDFVTGLGRWETVSRSMVDAEEEKKREEAYNEAKQGPRKRSLQEQREELARTIVDTHSESDNALGSFDPYNTGMYKGFKITSTDTREEELDLAKGQSVSFKKRTKGGAAKRARIEDD